MLPSTVPTVSASATLPISWLNPPPHPITVYASHPPSPTTAQHSLPGGALPPCRGRSFTGRNASTSPDALGPGVRIRLAPPASQQTSANNDRDDEAAAADALFLVCGLASVTGFFFVSLVLAELAARGHVDVAGDAGLKIVGSVKAAGTVGTKIESRAVPRDRRVDISVPGRVNFRTEVDRGRPGVEGGVPRRHPDTIWDASSGALGTHEHLQPVPPDGRTRFVILAAQLRDQDGGPNVPSSPSVLT